MPSLNNYIVQTKPLILLALVIELAACATPSEHFAATAEAFEFRQMLVDSRIFSHRLFINNSALADPPNGVLHVYLDGDGSPWSHRRWLNEDPTSRNPFILELMHLDPNPSLLLGRPCYHGLSKIPPCTYKYWTSQRYSEEVVASMTRALQIWLKKHTFNEIVLIGFSGGGTLAVLMAPRFDNVRTVVTVAANLDVEAWSRYHGYSPLTDSLNPAELPPLKNIKQIHIAGLDDEVVPAEIIKAYANKQTDAAYWPFEGYSHKCCWAKAWKAILTKF